MSFYFVKKHKHEVSNYLKYFIGHPLSFLFSARGVFTAIRKLCKNTPSLHLSNKESRETNKQLIQAISNQNRRQI